jgi:hypothetical protein
MFAIFSTILVYFIKLNLATLLQAAMRAQPPPDGAVGFRRQSSPLHTPDASMDDSGIKRNNLNKF